MTNKDRCNSQKKWTSNNQFYINLAPANSSILGRSVFRRVGVLVALAMAISKSRKHKILESDIWEGGKNILKYSDIYIYICIKLRRILIIGTNTIWQCIVKKCRNGRWNFFYTFLSFRQNIKKFTVRNLQCKPTTIIIWH